MEDAELLALYGAERDAYYQYVKVSRGDTLGVNSQVSPKRVREARTEWQEAYEARLEAGLGTEATMALLQRIAKEVNRGKRRS